MTDYSELVKALRERAQREEEWYEHGGDVINDAAAAIEELQAEIRESMQKCAECGDRMVEPKRGEWIIHGEPPMLVIECSVCGQKYFNHVMQEKAKYCSMCGAKMEVQDG